MSRYIFLFGLMVFAILVFSLYRAKYNAHETARQIAEVEREIKEAEALHETLWIEFSHRSRQEWLESYARLELGMIPVRAGQFVHLENLDDLLGPPVPDQQVNREDEDVR